MRTATVFALVLVFLAVALGGQAVGDAAVQSAEKGSVTQSAGRAGFAYLTGLRTYAAAVLWNSIDPIMDTYFRGKPFDENRFMLPIISAVVALDPHFTQAYSVGTWIIARNGKLQPALDLARRGVENNPNSGTCRVAYAQLLQTMDKDLPAAHKQAAAALGDHVTWDGTQDASDGLRSVLAIMRAAKDEDGIAKAKEAIKRADAAWPQDDTP